MRKTDNAFCRYFSHLLKFDCFTGDNVENVEQEDASSAAIQINGQESGDAPGYHSEISSLAEGKHGTDDGYEGDSSNSDDDYQWLIELDKRRNRLPNFWLILNVENTHVNVYFHCRFVQVNILFLFVIFARNNCIHH